jgi:hypothetical protein
MPAPDYPELFGEQRKAQLDFDRNHSCWYYPPPYGIATKIFAHWIRVKIIHVYRRDGVAYAWVDTVNKLGDDVRYSPFYRLYRINSWEGEVLLSKVRIDGQELTEDLYEKLVKGGVMTRPKPDLLGLIEVMQHRHEQIKQCRHENEVQVPAPYECRGAHYTYCQDCDRNFWRTNKQKDEVNDG